MSIDPVAAAQQRQAAEKKASSPGAAPAIPFQELLAGRPVSAEPVSVSTAADILRLKMLGAAVSLGDDQKLASQRSLGMQDILDRFLAQVPLTAAAAGVNVAPGTAGTGDAAAAEVAPVAVAGDVAGQHLPVDAIIEKASRRYGVDSGLIKAVIKAESDFNPRAVSSAGAQGLMQLMPSTARGLGVTDSFDPEQNVMGGTRFLKDMLQRYGGNVDEALAAYNWGPGNVDRHGTERLPRETKVYLGKVKDYYTQFMA